MLYRYSEIFRTTLMISDLLLVASSWALAYWLRFFTGWSAPQGIPELEPYLYAMLGILPLAFITLRSRGLYLPQRTGSLIHEVGGVLSAVGVTVVIVFAADAALRTYLSRAVIALFAVLAAGSISAFRIAGRGFLGLLRRKGHNLRYLLVVGTGDLAAKTIDSIHGHPEAGLRVLGLLSNDTAVGGHTIQGVRVVGDYASVKQQLRTRRVDQVVIAMPKEDSGYLEKILADLDDEIVTVRLIPDLLHVMTLRSSVEDLDGLPVINLRESPLVGWAGIQKRVFDVAATSAVLLVAGPLMGLIAIVAWITSGRPILFAQERMGLDGRVFRMLKFRSMPSDAESETGPVWTTAGDVRATPLGSLLRKTSLDELPQLWNVLRGDMSLVGPRPERPVFIEEFRREIQGYMLRHKVKAGLTGWAQVHGWRGNTSLHERIEHDIYYIQNWTLGLDIRILLMSLWRVWFHRNAY
jgi:Undecaprenyl-phosphate glucose phosphotransferase